MEKILVKNLACCKNKTAPQFGCTDKYYKNRKKYNKKYRSKYKYKKPRRRYYVKNYKTKRPYRPKRKLTEKTSILCHPNVETGRRGKPFRGVNKVEALIRRKYPLKYDASSNRKT